MFGKGYQQNWRKRLIPGPTDQNLTCYSGRTYWYLQTTQAAWNCPQVTQVTGVTKAR